MLGDLEIQEQGEEIKALQQNANISTGNPRYEVLEIQYQTSTMLFERVWCFHAFVRSFELLKRYACDMIELNLHSRARGRARPASSARLRMYSMQEMDRDVDDKPLT